jgi:diaminobutyrate-2-oxoglutarate transaminase
MIGVELVDPAAEFDDYGSLPAAPALAVAVQQEALRRGLIVELGGRHGSTVRLLPPLPINDEQAEAVLDRLADSLAAAERSMLQGVPAAPAGGAA